MSVQCVAVFVGHIACMLISTDRCVTRSFLSFRFLRFHITRSCYINRTRNMIVTTCKITLGLLSGGEINLDLRLKYADTQCWFEYTIVRETCILRISY
jgi:hypothetical protein